MFVAGRAAIGHRRTSADPRRPAAASAEGAILNTLGLIGGVGGTITLAAYGYWLNAKGWTTPAG